MVGYDFSKMGNLGRRENRESTPSNWLLELFLRLSIDCSEKNIIAITPVKKNTETTN